MIALLQTFPPESLGMNAWFFTRCSDERRLCASYLAKLARLATLSGISVPALLAFAQDCSQ